MPRELLICELSPEMQQACRLAPALIDFCQRRGLVVVVGIAQGKHTIFNTAGDPDKQRRLIAGLAMFCEGEK